MQHKTRLGHRVSRQAGFTLIEILVVIGIIALLAAVVIIAINPARQFAQARNAQRESNINTILNAIGQNIVDNKGTFTCAGVGTAPGAVAAAIGTGAVNLTCLVPTYIPSSIPTDPVGGSAADTKYTVAMDTLGRFTVCAPNSVEAALGSPAAVCVVR